MATVHLADDIKHERKVAVTDIPARSHRVSVFR